MTEREYRTVHAPVVKLAHRVKLKPRPANAKATSGTFSEAGRRGFYRPSQPRSR